MNVRHWWKRQKGSKIFCRVPALQRAPRGSSSNKKRSCSHELMSSLWSNACTLFYYFSIHLIKVFQFISVKKATLNLGVFILFFPKILVRYGNALPSTDAPMLAVLFGLSSVCVAFRINSDIGLCETADLMLWLYYYSIQLPRAIRSISYSNDFFCEEKKLTKN